MTPHKLCRVAGCKRPVQGRNTSGCCKTHVHAIGYCQCKVCAIANKPVPPPKPAKPEPRPLPAAIKRVTTPDGTSVTLTKGPWE